MRTLSGAFDDTMHDELRSASSEGPVARDEITGSMVVLEYHEIDRLTRDHRLAGIGLSIFDLLGIEDGPLRRWYGSLMFTNEGDVHTRLRMLVSRAFTPRSVDRLRSVAATLAEDAFVDLRRDGGGDLVAAFGRVPIRVMCRLLGVPEHDVDVFGEWADALSPTFVFMDPPQIAAATEAVVALLDYVDRLAERRRQDPADDLITALLDAEADGERLTRDELVDMVANLIVGGHDTTASQLGCSLLTLLRHPDAVADVRADQGLVASAAAETIRFEPSIDTVPRTSLEDLEILGHDVATGSLVMLATAAANRQADVWHDPDTFDVTRFEMPSVPKLLSFGAGPHYCLGAALARMTIEEAIRAYVEAPPVTPAFDVDDVEWRSVLGRSPAALPVNVGAVSGL